MAPTALITWSPDYKLVNRSAANFAPSSTQAFSEISTVNSSNARSIDVTLRLPTDLQASIDKDRFITVWGCLKM